MAYQVSLSKDRFKFSATHFTIFGETEAENLHGHNYQVSLNIVFKDLKENIGMTAEFSEIKKILKETCDQLDEKVLLPNLSPFVEMGETETNLEVKYHDRFYSFPKKECEVLEIVNTSSECLAQWVYEAIRPKLTELGARSFSVTLQETQGQRVTFEEESLAKSVLSGI